MYDKRKKNALCEEEFYAQRKFFLMLHFRFLIDKEKKFHKNIKEK